MTTPTAERKRGRVLWLSFSKTFGFIAAEGTRAEYFFHTNSIDNCAAVRPGIKVSFAVDPSDSHHGARAIAVRIID